MPRYTYINNVHVQSKANGIFNKNAEHMLLVRSSPDTAILLPCVHLVGNNIKF